MTCLAIQAEHTLHVGALPELHNDPFDRLIVAQAQLLGCTVTADPTIAKYQVDTMTV